MELDAVRMICAVSAVAAGTFTSGTVEDQIEQVPVAFLFSQDD